MFVCLVVCLFLFFFSIIIFATITVSVSVVMAVIVPAWPCYDWACNKIPLLRCMFLFLAGEGDLQHSSQLG